MNYKTNPYAYPEEHGLRIVVEGDDPEASYSFCMFVVWTDGQRLYYAEDSGCSCPSPFESYETEDSYGLISGTGDRSLMPATKTEVFAAIDNWVDANSYTAVEAQWQVLGINMKEKIRDWSPD